MSDPMVSPEIDAIINRLREEIALEQVAIQARIRELRVRRDESKSTAAYSGWTEQMLQAHREGYARLEPLRRELDTILRAVGGLLALKSVPQIVIEQEKQ